jgi:hypothetical protein
MVMLVLAVLVIAAPRHTAVSTSSASSCCGKRMVARLQKENAELRQAKAVNITVTESGLAYVHNLSMIPIIYRSLQYLVGSATVELVSYGARSRRFAPCVFHRYTY